MRGIAKACFFLGGLFALAALAWMALLPAVVERGLRGATGFDIRIRSLAADPFSGWLVARGLTARNPPEYPAPDFVSIREVRADVDVLSWLFSDRVVVNELFVDAQKVEIVRPRGGGSNAGEFFAALSRRKAQAPGQGAPDAQRRPTRCLVRKLRIRLDELVIADYSRPKPDEVSYGLNIDHTFANVSDPRQLLVPDVVRRLCAIGFSRDTAGLLPGDFGRALGDAVGEAQQLGAKLKDAEHRTEKFLRGLFDKLEQSPKP